MAVANTARLSIEGSLPRGERFAWSLWLLGVGGGTVPSTNTAAATFLQNIMALSKWQPLITACLAYAGGGTNYETARVYCYPNGGKIAAASAARPISNGGGAGSTGFLPNQVSRVVTLNTDKLGRSYRGRVYIPATATTALSSGLFSTDGTPLIQAFADLAAQLQLGSVLPGSGTVEIVVASSRVGAATFVNAFSTDNRPDVQRRRANKMTGITRVSVPIPVA